MLSGDQLGGLPFIAEDLGLITADVSALRDQFRIPGTRVLQFAFDGTPDNPHLPERYDPNTVVYTGTHDNNTTRGWFEALPEEHRQRVRGYLKRPDIGDAEIGPPADRAGVDIAGGRGDRAVPRRAESRQ